MRLTEVERDREKVPLMKALHELGLTHGVEFVVVYKPIGQKGPLRAMVIDHKEHTPMNDVAIQCGISGMFLIQASGAAAEAANEAPAPAESP